MPEQTSLELYNKGQSLFDLERYIEAIEQYREAIKLDNQYQDAYLGWSRCLAKLDEPAPAFEEFRKEIQTNFNNQIGHGFLANALFILERYEEAIVEYKLVLKEESPSNMHWFHDWGLALERLKRYAEAIEPYREAIKLDNAYRNAYSGWSRCLAKLADPAPAFEEFRKQVQINFKNRIGHELLASAFFNLERYQEAIGEYKQALKEESPNNKLWFHNWGLALERLERYAEAIEPYREATKLDKQYEEAYSGWSRCLAKVEDPAPEFQKFQKQVQREFKNQIGHELLASAFFDLERYEEAIVEYKQAVKEESLNNKLWLYNWGLALERMERYVEAIAQYQELIKLDEKYEDAYAGWSRCLAKLDESALAFEEFRKEVQSNFKNRTSHELLANALFILKRYEESIVEYQQVLKEDASDNKLWFHDHGLALERLERYAEAIEQYREAIKLDNQYENSYSGWSRCLPKLDDPVSAFEEFRKAVQSEYPTWHGYTLLGDILNYDLKSPHDSIEYFKRAVALKSTYVSAHYGWGNALLNCYRYEEALERFQKARKCDPSYVYAIHNTAYVLGILGRYSEARSEWNAALETYESINKKARSKDDVWYLIYAGSIYRDKKQYDLAKNSYNKALDLDRQNTDLLLASIDLYLELKAEAIEEDEKVKRKRNEANSEAWKIFRKLEPRILKKLEAKDEPEKRLYLAKLYIAFKEFEKAKVQLDALVELDSHDTQALALLGSVQMNQEFFKKAISRFSTVLEIDPSNHEVRSNLGSSLLKLNKRQDAEVEFRKVLDPSPSHMPSLAGLGEVYKEMGDVAESSGKTAEADERYREAIELFEECLQLNDTEEGSKILTKNEFSEIHYSLGYSKVKLSEVQSHKDGKLIDQAQKHFYKVISGTPNVHKAKRAIKSIKELEDKVQNKGSTLSAWIIFGLAVATFVFAQIGFYFGKPELGFESYTINPAELTIFATKKAHEFGKGKAAEIDQILEGFHEQITRLSEEAFVSHPEVVDQIKHLLKTENLTRDDLARLIKNEGKLRINAITQIGETSYALISFGALIFAVSGLYLQQISKLKFGAIEMEKTVTTQSAFSGSLGITK